MDKNNVPNSIRSVASRCAIWASQFLVAGLASLWITSPAHAAPEVYVQPIFLYTDYYYSKPERTTLAQAWQDAQTDWNWGTCPSYCEYVTNLHPDTTDSFAILYNGLVYYFYYFDIIYCSSGTCSTYNTNRVIEGTYQCPGAGFYNSLQEPNPDPNVPRQITVLCNPLTPPDVLPPPPPEPCPICEVHAQSPAESYQGDPIAAATGQKIQVESDYSGPSGLGYVRTYRSETGSFSSITNAGFLDFSQPLGTPFPACFPSYWTNNYNSQRSSACFPSIAVGQQAYAWASTDGQFTQFSGPNNAVTQKADINERVTQTTFNGANAWQVKRQDDSTEIYAAATGQLQERIARNGQTTAFAYSTSSTPTNIAPGPGYLLSETGPFGHALSWTYNSSGQLYQMTDPAGGVYTYGYNASGDLSSVSYPDGTSRSYSYSGTAGQLSELTGVTDESGILFASSSYNNSSAYTSFATNTQLAGGVDSYTFTYDAGAYYGNPVTSTVVVDPLGTSRTFQFAQVQSYNRDQSLTQPAASGSGNATESWSYDANGNVSQFTDFNGEITTHTFDQTRNLELSRTEASGTAQARTITTQWSSAYRLPVQISVYPNGTGTGTALTTTTFNYDSSGNLLTKTVTDPATSTSRTWTYTYDGYGRMLTADGPRTDVTDTTTYAYYTCTTGYQCGQVHTITDALGHITTFNTYNAHGQPLTITDPNGVVTTLTYDLRQRLTSRQIGTETTSYSLLPDWPASNGDAARQQHDYLHLRCGASADQNHRRRWAITSLHTR